MLNTQLKLFITSNTGPVCGTAAKTCFKILYHTGVGGSIPGIESKNEKK